MYPPHMLLKIRYFCSKLVQVIQCFVLVMEYIRGSETPECIFHNQHIHCITYLALTQLFPVLLTSRFQIVKYTHYVAFCCISFRSLSFLAQPWMRPHGTNRSYKQHFCLILFSKLSWKHFADHTLQMHTLISTHCLCILT